MTSPLTLGGKVIRALRREADLRRGRLRTAALAMTYKCNLTCRTCGVWIRGKTDRKIELTTAEILETARQLREMGVTFVVLVGSEPLMRKDTLDVIDGLRAMGFEILLITNGTLVTETVAERLVRAGVTGVTVSVDAVGERHDQIRGQERVYERVMEGLARLREAKEQAGAERPELAVHATISLWNTDVLEEISGLSEALGVTVSFQLVSETSPEEVEATRFDGKVIAGTELVPRDGTFLPDEEGVRRIRAFLRKPGILRKHPSLSVLAAMSDEDIRRGWFPVRTCNVVRSEILIDPYGEVHPCSHLDGYSYGNVREQTVREIWEGERRKRLVNRVRRELFPVCRKCCQHQSNFTPLQKVQMLLRG